MEGEVEGERKERELLHAALIGSHDGDSLLGTTRVVSGTRMLIYWAGSSQMASPRERRPMRGHG